MTVAVVEAPIERFRRRLDVVESGCWLWTWPLTNGYGRFGNERAHRWSYEHFVGPIPDGLDLDHLCHTADESCPGGTSCPHRACVNPSHLEPVTRTENILRGRGPDVQRARHAAQTHCKHGHEFTPENTRITARGYRRCRECARQLAREAYWRNR